MSEGVYGMVPHGLAAPAGDAVQVSPLVPGSRSLEDVVPQSMDRMTVLAPPGTLERRYVLALALRALKAGGTLVVMAPVTRGGGRIGKELASFGGDVDIASRKHHKVAKLVRPTDLNGIEAALEDGGLRLLADGLWSQAGVFSWNKADAGTALLRQTLPALKGQGADFGCGIGVLALQVLQSPAVTRLAMIDIDRRAIAAARRNVSDDRAEFFWTDLRITDLGTGLDFVVMNPPFHDGGAEDKALGLAFIQKAAASLRRSGSCWLVANRHLPYEAPLRRLYKEVTLKADAKGFKVYEAVK